MHLSITGPLSLILTVGEGHLHISIDSEDEHAGFGPLHMLAASLATCTASVLESYAETSRQEIEGTRIELTWDYVDNPYRVGEYVMHIHWPSSLPEGRQRALLRVAEQCTVHATLSHPPTITTAVVIPTE